MTPDELKDLALEALRLGQDFADGHLLMGEVPLDADFEYAADLPDDERERLLRAVLGDPGLSEDDRREHLGAAPIPADRATHVYMRSVVQHADPSAVFVGEEATLDEWDEAVDAVQPGRVLWLADSVDGSLPYEALTFGYSSNLLVYRRGLSQDRLIVAVVGNSSRLTAVYKQADDEGTGEVLLGRVGGEFKTLQDPLCQDIRADTVAVLGTTWGHREGLQPLLADRHYTVFTTGGAPASLGLIAGKLGALACTKPQTIWDAAYLPILARLNIPIFTADGTLLGLQDVLRFFNHVARDQKDRRDKPVPPFVAARHPDFAAALLEKLFRDQGQRT
jgi:hypothetical protein